MGVSARSKIRSFTAGLASVAVAVAGLTLTAPAQAAPGEGSVEWTQLIRTDDTSLFGLYGTEYPYSPATPRELYSLARVGYQVNWPDQGSFTAAQAVLIRCLTDALSSCGSNPTILQATSISGSTANPQTAFTYSFAEPDIGRFVRIRLRVFVDSLTPIETFSDPVRMFNRPPTDTSNIDVSWQPAASGPYISDGSQIIVDVPQWRSPGIPFTSRTIQAYQCPTPQITSLSGCTRLAEQTFTDDAPSNWRFDTPAFTGTGFMQIYVRNAYTSSSTGFRQLWDRSTPSGVPMISQASLQQAAEASRAQTELVQACLTALGGVTLAQIQADAALAAQYTACLANNGQLPQDATAPTAPTDPTTTTPDASPPAAPDLGLGNKQSDTVKTVGNVTATLISVRAIKRGARLIAAVTVSPRDSASRATLSIHRCGKVNGKVNCTVPAKRVAKLKGLTITDGVGIRTNKVRKTLKPGRYALKSVVITADGKRIGVTQPLRIRK